MFPFPYPFPPQAGTPCKPTGRCTPLFGLLHSTPRLLPSPPPPASLLGHWGPPGAWIWASDSLLGASGSVSSRLQRFLVLMLWFGSQFLRGFGCSKLDFWTFQGVGGMAEPLNSRPDDLSSDRRVSAAFSTLGARFRQTSSIYLHIFSSLVLYCISYADHNYYNLYIYK